MVAKKKPAPKGKVMEKKTGEKYASKGAKMKHEKSEGKKEQFMEYGFMKSTAKKVAKKAAPKKGKK